MEENTRRDSDNYNCFFFPDNNVLLFENKKGELGLTKEQTGEAQYIAKHGEPPSLDGKSFHDIINFDYNSDRLQKILQKTGGQQIQTDLRTEYQNMIKRAML